MSSAKTHSKAVRCCLPKNTETDVLSTDVYVIGIDIIIICSSELTSSLVKNIGLLT